MRKTAGRTNLQAYCFLPPFVLSLAMDGLERYFLISASSLSFLATPRGFGGAKFRYTGSVLAVRAAQTWDFFPASAEKTRHL